VTLRSYGDSCGMAHGLDLVGERWALLVVRELLFGPQRFTDLRAGLPGASANVLSQRLRELEEAGVVRRRKLAPPAASQVYELTDWGRELEPILLALGCWAVRSPLLEPDGTISTVSAVLTLRTFFNPEGGVPWKASYELRFGDEQFSVDVDGDRIEVARGHATAPDATIATDPKTFTALITGGIGMAEAMDSKRLTVSGDVDGVAPLIESIAKPRPAARSSA
jgi:DNA-binding HxlR family transcriptional regulator